MSAREILGVFTPDQKLIMDEFLKVSDATHQEVKAIQEKMNAATSRMRIADAGTSSMLALVYGKNDVAVKYDRKTGEYYREIESKDG